MKFRFLRVFGLCLAALIVSAGMVACKPSPPASESEVPMFTLTSTAFKDGETIPVKFTCSGEDLSPQLAWTDLPTGTQSLALIVDDPDAPVGTFVHWVLFDISPQLNELPEDASAVGIDGSNSWRRNGYGGPCPPPGKPHRYFFKLYALDKKLGLKPGATKSDIEKAIQGHILARAQLMGKFGR